MPESGEQSKRCRDCGEVKGLSDFWRNKKAADGRALYCTSCFRRRNAESADRRAARAGRTRRPQKRLVVTAPEGFRFCPSCETVLPLESFVRNKTTTTGYGSYCRPCQNAKATESRERLHGGARHYHLRRRYGIGSDDVVRLLAAQGGCCAVCLRPLTVKQCHVDHDHATGNVRGILCFNCNGGLGQFRDDVRLLRRAARYLVGHARPERQAHGFLGYVVVDHPTPSRHEVLLAARLAERGGGTAV